jgi:hypothetical protein
MNRRSFATGLSFACSLAMVRGGLASVELKSALEERVRAQLDLGDAARLPRVSVHSARPITETHGLDCEFYKHYLVENQRNVLFTGSMAIDSIICGLRDFRWFFAGFSYTHCTTMQQSESPL